MSDDKTMPSAALARLEASRQRVVRELSQVQRALASEFGWAPALKTWGLPLIGFAAGVALALKLGKSRRRKQLAPQR